MNNNNDNNNNDDDNNNYDNNNNHNSDINNFIVSQTIPSHDIFQIFVSLSSRPGWEIRE